MLSLQDGIKKSKELYRKITFPHTIIEIDNTEGLSECTTCGGIEGTLLHDCPGYECGKILDDVYFKHDVTEISRHWNILLIQARRNQDDALIELIRNV